MPSSPADLSETDAVEVAPSRGSSGFDETRIALVIAAVSPLRKASYKRNSRTDCSIDVGLADCVVGGCRMGSVCCEGFCAMGELVSDFVDAEEGLPSPGLPSLCVETLLRRDLATPDLPRVCFCEASWELS